MWNSRELWSVPLNIVVQLIQRHSQQLHILGYAQNFGLRQLDEIELLALFRSRDVAGNERVHEGLEVWAPPLREGVGDIPVVVAVDGAKTLIETCFEARDLFVFSA